MSCKSTSCPPSPIPPWHRKVVNSEIDEETITGDDTIDLSVTVTILNQTTPKDGVPTPYTVILPNVDTLCASPIQKEIYIPRSQANLTAPFRVTGTFNGFTSLLFNLTGQNAILRWVSGAWNLNGGNALAE
jgi:hypothetical protein